jgi:hypothetical protein
MSSDGTTHEGATAAGSTTDQDRPMHEPASDYEQGRVDEARQREGRFARAPESERTDDPSRTGR